MPPSPGSHDAAPADERRVVLFDLDGVLTRRDTFSTLVVRRLRRSLWRVALAVPALPVLAATGRYPSVRGCASRYLVRVALAGMSLNAARDLSAELGREFARNHDWLRRDVMDAARDHDADGDRVVVVTATERNLAQALLDGVGLGGLELHASELGRTLTGPGLTRHNYGRRKRHTLTAAGVPQPWTVMYSDSWADHDLLDIVEEVVLVAPSDRLRRIGMRRWAGRCSVHKG
jgi:phosphatidylglycerophosphatase C